MRLAGVRNRVADARPIDAAITRIGDHLHLHHLGMIRAVVVHDVEDRDAFVRGGPQRAWGEHQIAVAADAHRQTSMLLVRQRRAKAGPRKIAQPITPASPIYW